MIQNESLNMNHLVIPLIDILYLNLKNVYIHTTCQIDIAYFDNSKETFLVITSPTHTTNVNFFHFNNYIIAQLTHQYTPTLIHDHNCNPFTHPINSLLNYPQLEGRKKKL